MAPNKISPSRAKLLLLVMVVNLVMIVALVGKVEGTVLLDHIVGGRLGWNFPPNTTYYEEWAANRTFVVGDKLVFMYRSGMQNVMEVPKEDFDKCTDDKIIDWQYQGPTVIVLKTPGPHYYYSAIAAHCEHGQKLAIDVHETAVSDPARDGLGTATSAACSLAFSSTTTTAILGFTLLLAFLSASQ